MQPLPYQRVQDIPNRVLDAYLAEHLMGWQRTDELDTVSTYSTSLDACAELEAKLTAGAEDSLLNFYGYQMQMTVLGHSYPSFTALDVLKLANATARQRCEALYITLVASQTSLTAA